MGLLVDLLSYSAAITGLFCILALALLARGVYLMVQHNRQRHGRDDSDSH